MSAGGRCARLVLTRLGRHRARTPGVPASTSRDSNAFVVVGNRQVERTPADATLRLTAASGVVDDVRFTASLVGGYTRGGDAGPGSRCKSDTVLATVTRELESHVATGPAGLGRQGESARPGSQEIACIVV